MTAEAGRHRIVTRMNSQTTGNPPEPLDRTAGTPAGDRRRTRRAVLAGVGEARNHPGDGDPLTDATALAARAVAAAAVDAGSAGILDSVGIVAMPVGSDDAPDPAGALTEALGLDNTATMVAAIGVPQQRLVSNAILAVETGAADAVLVVGSEAKASALAAKRAGQVPPGVSNGPGATFPLAPSGEFMADAEVAAMLWDPVVQYAMIDSALARHEGDSPTQLSTDVSELWARFDSVAASNPEACFSGPPHTAESLATSSDDNRLLAFPYNKWHSTQWALDHAAALLVSTEEVARANGADRDHLLHPHVALDSSFGLTLARRAEPHRWPAIGVMGDAAAEHLGHPVSEIDLVELYSCFPASVRLQQRELGFPLDGTPTLLGGMPFAGGPFNHFTYMATAEVARRLRAGHGAQGLVTTVSGLLTKAGLTVWGRDPVPGGAMVADLAADVQQATGTRDVASFDESVDLDSAGDVLAATITGGFDPKLFALTEDRDRVRRLVAEPVPDGDPAATLADL